MLQLLAVSAVLFSVLYFSISFPFGRAVSASFTSEADVAGFLGLFSGLASAVTFVAALLIANRLYARIGVVNSLLLLPLTYFLGFVLFAASFTLTSAVIVRLMQLVVLSGVGDGAYSTFFNIVPSEKRAQVRGFDAGVAAQIGIILSGLLLILGHRVLDTTQIVVMGMITALACGYVIWRMRRGYAEALVAALRAGRFEVFAAGSTAFAGFQGDASAIRVAVNALHHARPSMRRLGAEMLMKMGAVSAVPALLTALQDGEAEVRGMAARALGELEASQATDAVVSLLLDPDASVRVSALQSLPRLLSDPSSTIPTGMLDDVSSLLNDNDVPVQTEAAVVLAQLGGAEKALPTLELLLHADDPNTRAMALGALGTVVAIDPALGIQTIIQALTDGSALVRRAACTALGNSEDAAAYHGLISCLNDSDDLVPLVAASLKASDTQMQATAIEVLDQIGDKALAKAIIPLLEDQTSQAGDGRASTLNTADTIIRLLAEDDRWLRAPAARAIGELQLRDLLPNLHALVADSDPLVSATARDSLQQLGEPLGEPMETLQTVSLMERIILLREVPLFAGLSPDDLKQVADIARERWYPDGTVIMREGDDGNELHVIAAGEVRVTKSVSGEDKLLATRTVGEVVGEVAIIESAVRLCTLHAQGDGRTLSIDGNMFKTILRDRPDVSLAVLRGLSRRLRERDYQIGTGNQRENLK